jgi:CBS domain-containing protein
MNIEQIMTKDVDCCGPDDNMNRAAQIMWERDCGIVPITDPARNRRLVGVVTDRDICMAAYTRGQRLDEIRIGDVMSSRVHACRPDDAPGRVEDVMKKAQVHRLPVVDQENQLVGIVSLADLARRARNSGATAKSRTEPTASDIGETIAAISQPRVRSLMAM